MDLSFGLYTLEEIFKRVGQKKDYSFSSFFEKMSYDLSELDGRVLCEILDDNIKILSNETYLQNNEINELKVLILNLGKSDITSQERMISLSVENLKKLTTDSKDVIFKKGDLYKKLITFLGICIGIILI